MFKDLLTPTEVAEKLGVSKAFIFKCIRLGAPVQRWGSTGNRYKLDPDKFEKWMSRRFSETGEHQTQLADELAESLGK